jgi:hypothetical protein
MSSRRQPKRPVLYARTSARYLTRRSAPESHGLCTVPDRKIAAVPIKFSNHWRDAEDAFVQVQQVDAPLTRFRVVQPQRLRLDVQMLLWIIDFKLLEVGVAIEELFVIRDAVILDPIVGTNQTIRKPAHMSFPVADKEIEVVSSIVRGSRRLTSCRTC